MDLRSPYTWFWAVLQLSMLPASLGLLLLTLLHPGLRLCALNMWLTDAAFRLLAVNSFDWAGFH